MNAHAPKAFGAVRAVKALCSDGRMRSVRFIPRHGSMLCQTTVDGCAVTGSLDETTNPPTFKARGRNSDLVGDV